MEIDKKHDLVKKTDLSIVQINAALERLLASHKLSEAKLWKRRLLPPEDKTTYAKNEKAMFDMYIRGYHLDYISYVFKLNPDTLRKTLHSRRNMRGLDNRGGLGELERPSLGRNRMLMEMIHFINHHFNDLTARMDERNKQVFRRNLDVLTEDLVEDCIAEPKKEESDNGD